MNCSNSLIWQYIIWSLIYSGGAKPTASMYVWHPTSCWWKTRAIFWGGGGGTWSWTRCSFSKAWLRNTGKQSLLSEGELLDECHNNFSLSRKRIWDFSGSLVNTVCYMPFCVFLMITVLRVVREWRICICESSLGQIISPMRSFPCQRFLCFCMKSFLISCRLLVKQLSCLIKWDISVYLLVSRGFSSSTLLYRIL